MGPTLSLNNNNNNNNNNKERSRGQLRETERERDKILFLFSLLLSSIYVVSIVGIRRVKNKSLSTRRGLRVSTKNMGFL